MYNRSWIDDTAFGCSLHSRRVSARRYEATIKLRYARFITLFTGGDVYMQLSRYKKRNFRRMQIDRFDCTTDA